MSALATNQTSSFDVIRYQTISKFSAESGYTEYAIRAKIRDGVWLQGRVWVKAPDGRILISIEGYNLWAEEGLASAPSATATVTLAVDMPTLLRACSCARGHWSQLAL